MALNIPYSSVPLGQAGTGAAFILNQGVANAPVLTAERLARQPQILADREAARRAKEVAADISRINALKASGQAGSYHLDVGKKMLGEHLTLQEEATRNPTPENYVKLRTSTDKLTAYYGQSTVADQEADKLTAGLVSDRRFKSDARDRIIQDNLIDPTTGEKYAPDVFLTNLQKANRYSTKYLDRQATLDDFRDKLRLAKSEETSGSRRPGGVITSDNFADYLIPEKDANGKALRDPLTNAHLPDYNNAENLRLLDSDPALKAFIDEAQAQMSEAAGGPVTRGEAAKAVTALALRGDRTVDYANVPYGPQGTGAARASAITASPAVASISTTTPQSQPFNAFTSLNIPGVIDGNQSSFNYGTPDKPAYVSVIGQSVQRKDGGKIELSVDLAAPGVFLRNEKGGLSAAPKATGFSTTTPFQPQVVGWVVTDSKGVPVGTSDPNDTPDQALANALRLAEQTPGAKLVQGMWGSYTDNGNVKQGSADGPTAGRQITGWKLPNIFGSMDVVDEKLKAEYEAANPGKRLQPVYSAASGTIATQREAFVPNTQRYENAIKSQTGKVNPYAETEASRRFLARATELGLPQRRATGWAYPKKATTKSKLAWDAPATSPARPLVW